jgi:F0F1-type ATP synthase delta subunit
MNTFSELSPFLLTVEDRNILLSEVGELKQAMYSTEASKLLDHLFSTKIRHSTSHILQKIFQANPEVNVFEQIEGYLHQLQVIRIIIAFEPSSEQVELIAQKAQSPEGVPRLLDIEVDQEIMGGAQISIAGKYGDFSLRTRVIEYWEQHGGEIIQRFFSR